MPVKKTPEIVAAAAFVKKLDALEPQEAVRAAAAALRYAEHLAREVGFTPEQITLLDHEGRNAGKREFVPVPPVPKGLSYKPGTKWNPTDEQRRESERKKG